MPLSPLPVRYRSRRDLPPFDAPDGLLSPFADDDAGPAFDPASAYAQPRPSEDPDTSSPRTDPLPKPPRESDTAANASIEKLPPLDPNSVPKGNYSGLKSLNGKGVMPPPGEPMEAPPELAGTSTGAPSPAANATTPTTAGPAPETASIGMMDKDIDTKGLAPAKPSGGVVAPGEPTTPEERRAALQRPDAPGNNWAQRVGLAILSMSPKLAPVANQIIHPKWAADEAKYQRDLANEGEIEKLEEGQARTEAYAAQKEAQGANYAATQETRKQQAQAHTQDMLIKSGASMLGPNEDIPQGFVPAINPANPSEKWARRSAFVPLPKEMLPFFPGKKEGDQVTSVEYDSALKANWAQMLEDKKAENKPDKAVAAKQTFQATLSKIAAGEGLPPDAVTNVGSLTRALQNSKTLSPQEKSDALAYLAANPTPAATATNMTIRMAGMAQSREYPVINKDTGQLEMRSAAEINQAPGTFAPASGGAAAMGKNAVFQDLHYNIDTARKAINALENMDSGTRAALSFALRHTDPRSAMQTFLGGEVGAHLNPQQQEAVQSLALLAENAMSLRSVAGMGQGSEELRSAILATLPSGKSPSKGYALSQLNKFENVVTRLEHGVPGMGKVGGGPQGGGKIVVTAPDGSTHPFDTQAQADAFKKLAKIP